MLLWEIAKCIVILLAVLLLILLVIALVSKKSLPDLQNRRYSEHFPFDPQTSPIARHLAAQLAQHPKESGIYPLGNGRDAFLARLALAEMAQQSLDLQYYIWHDDISGRLLAQSLLNAAKRGVRVRLLLDDHTMAGMDPMIATLDRQQNIEVRLFNPYMQRSFRPLGYLSDFFRLNRRMHNKSFTADSTVTIVGGRNIGDEYFGATDGVFFADLDVVAAGDAAAQTAVDFDRYWNSESAYPAAMIIGEQKEIKLCKKGKFPKDTARDEATQSYLQLLGDSDFARHLREGNLPMTWAKTTLVSDTPAKVLGKSRQQENLMHKHIRPLMASAQQELILVSPYFVPTKNGEKLLGKLAKQGKQVHVLTNTLAANDVAMVHAGYAKYRKALLKQGVKLYELKADATVKPGKQKNVYDGSGASLHAKTFSVDGRYLYVGSFNFDPRSANLNTEMGLIIDHPEMAEQLRKNLEKDQLMHAYGVSLNHEGKLQWQTRAISGQLQTSPHEPTAAWLRRAQVWIASKLPIEWLL